MTLTTAAFGFAALSGALLCLLGGYCYRRWREPGVVPFAVSTALFGIVGVAGSGAAILRETPSSSDSVPLFVDIGFGGWMIAMVPWALFALQYTGRFTRLRPRTVLAVTVPALGVPLAYLGEFLAFTEPSILFQLLGTITLFYVIGLAALGCYLLLRTNYEYGHLSNAQGVLLSAAVIGPLVCINLIGAARIEGIAASVVYGVAFGLPAATLGLAVFGTGLFDSTPAAGALGERAIPRETDDLVFVIDRDGIVVKINRTALDRLGISEPDSLGRPFDEVLEPTVQRLRTTETVELQTVAGTRKFDPQVTAFTDQHGRRLGSLLSLRDVTDRELRKQRLEVLNRVLRHNLRNRVDVIKGNAEAVADGSEASFAGSIVDSADELAKLSAKARSIDRLVSRPTRPTDGDLAAVVREITPAEAAVDLSVDCPASAPLVTDWEALRAAAESAIENAIEYASESVTVTLETTEEGYEIVVVDDGPGIPASELASIDAETETPLQHGTGLGLWRLKWGVTKLNGELSFDTADGTTVRMRIPDRREPPPTEPSGEAASESP
jgi:signal transduction histidine kinase